MRRDMRRAIECLCSRSFDDPIPTPKGKPEARQRLQDREMKSPTRSRNCMQGETSPQCGSARQGAPAVLGKAQFLGSRSGRALLDRLGEGVRDRVLVSVFAKAEKPKRGCKGRSQRSQTDPGSPFSSICKALRRGAHVGGATSKSIVCRRPV